MPLGIRLALLVGLAVLLPRGGDGAVPPRSDYDDLLVTARAGIPLKVLKTNFLFDGGSCVVTLVSSLGRELGLVILNPKRAERMGISVAPYDLQRHVVLRISPEDEAALKSALVLVLTPANPITSMATPAESQNARTLISVLQSKAPISPINLQWIK